MKGQKRFSSRPSPAEQRLAKREKQKAAAAALEKKIRQQRRIPVPAAPQPESRQELFPFIGGSILLVLGCVALFWLLSPSRNSKLPPKQAERRAEARQTTPPSAVRIPQKSGRPKKGEAPAQTVQTIAPKPATRDLLADSKTPVYWQQGKLNGRPAKPDDPLCKQEFSLLSSREKVVYVAGNQAFPQVIQAGQTVIVELNKLPAGVLEAHCAAYSGLPREKMWPWSQDRHGQFVQLRFNDQLIADHWQADSGLTVAGLVPVAMRRAGKTETFAIINKCTHSLAVDAVWIQAVEAGPKSWVALIGAEGLSKETGKPVAWVGLQLPWPYNEARKMPPPMRPAPKALSLMARQKLWQRKKYSARDGEDFFAEKVDQRVFREWRNRIGAAVGRGKQTLGIVFNVSAGNPSGFIALARYFAPFIQAWHLNSATEKDENVRKILAALRPCVPPGCISLDRGLPNKIGLTRDAQYPIALPTKQPWKVADHFLSFRQVSMDAGLPVGLVRNSVLDVFYPLSCRTYPDNCHAAFRTAQAVLSFFHAGGTRVMLHGFAPGTGPFWDGEQRPGIFWEIGRQLARIGAGAGRRLCVGVVPYDADYGLVDTVWHGEIKQKDQVEIWIWTQFDVKRRVTIYCPVPWKTAKTRLMMARWQVDGKSLVQAMPIEKQKIKTGPGTVRFEVSLGNFTRLRLRSGHYRPATLITTDRITPPSAVPFSRRRLPGMFKRLEQRLPPPGIWMQPVPLFSRFTRRLGREASISTRPSPMGTVAGYDQVAPWEKESLAIKLTAPAAPGPRGAEIPLNWAQNKSATQLEFWVYPISSASLPRVELILGSDQRYDRLLLKTNQWHGLRVRKKDLAPGHWHGATRLRLWNDGSRPEYRRGATVTVLINGLQILSTRSPKGQRLAVAKLKKRAETEEQVVYQLSAPGKGAFMVQLARKTPTTVKRIEIDNPDIHARFFTEARILRLWRDDLESAETATTIKQAVRLIKF